MATIVEAIRSGLKLSAGLKLRAGRMTKIIQPCSWCLVSAGAMGLKDLVTSADATDADASFFFCMNKNTNSNVSEISR